VRCQVTNPHFDAINEVISNPSDGYSAANYLNVTCKLDVLK